MPFYMITEWKLLYVQRMLEGKENLSSDWYMKWRDVISRWSDFGFHQWKKVRLEMALII